MAASINDYRRKNVLRNEDILHLVCDYLIDDDSIVELQGASSSTVDKEVLRRAKLHRFIRTGRSEGIKALYRGPMAIYDGKTMIGVAISFGSRRALSTLLSLRSLITDDEIAAAANLPSPHRLIALGMIHHWCPPLRPVLETIDDRTAA
jgi:hypothetical protein